jgi:hypothetical protein
MHLGIINHRKFIRARKRQIRRKYTKPLGEILKEFGYITQTELQLALNLQKNLDTHI